MSHGDERILSGRSGVDVVGSYSLIFYVEGSGWSAKVMTQGVNGATLP